MEPGYMKLNVSVWNRKKTSEGGNLCFWDAILGGCVVCMGMVRKLFNILIG
jgi:hypothetical protein